MEKQSEIAQSFSTTLYEAALKGDVTSLKVLINKDEYILYRCIIENSWCAKQSPLHIAVAMQHYMFVAEILRLKPELAEVVDQLKRSTPLHIAAATEGSLEIVGMLLEASSNMYFMHDQDGMTPLHVAAIKGYTELLLLLLHKKRRAALERTTAGETILHLCVKNSHLHTLKMVVEYTNDLELLNSQDSGGNTVLHLAVAYEETEMVKFLLEGQSNNIDKNATNKKGMTIKDIYLQASRSKMSPLEEASFSDIGKLLRVHDATAVRKTGDQKWLEEQNTALMVVASCIATLSFQVGISPPGGIWQDDDGHKAGVIIMSYDNDADLYNVVQVSNTVGLMSSLTVIILLISDFHCTRIHVHILRFTLWIAIMASATTYLYTIEYLTSDSINKAALVDDALDYCVEIWIWAISIILLVTHVFRSIWMLIWKFIGHTKRQD